MRCPSDFSYVFGGVCIEEWFQNLVSGILFLLPPKSPKSVYHNGYTKNYTNYFEIPKNYSNWFHTINFTAAEVWWSIDRRQFKKTCLFIFILLFFSPAAGGPLWPNAMQGDGRQETDVICRQLMYSQALPIGPTQIILRRSTCFLLFVLCPSDRCLHIDLIHQTIQHLSCQQGATSLKKKSLLFLQFFTNSISDLSKSAFCRCNQMSTVWTTMYDQLLFRWWHSRQWCSIRVELPPIFNHRLHPPKEKPTSSTSCWQALSI